MIGGQAISGTFRDLPFSDARITKHISSVFAGGTPDAHGDESNKNTYTIYTVTGIVLIHYVFAVCRVNLAGAATIDVGVTTDTDIFSPTQMGDTSNFDANEIWDGTAADPTLSAIVLSDDKDAIGTLVNGTTNNIVETITAADITSGQIDYYCVWTPMESGANIVEAGTLSDV